MSNLERERELVTKIKGKATDPLFAQFMELFELRRVKITERVIDNGGDIDRGKAQELRDLKKLFTN